MAIKKVSIKIRFLGHGYKTLMIMLDLFPRSLLPLYKFNDYSPI